MKMLLVAAALIGAGVWALYEYGGYKSYDPNQQGEIAQKTITPGMTYAQVLTIAPKPLEYGKILREVKKINGVEVETFHTGPTIAFDAQRLDARFEEGDFPYGFTLVYRFSRSIAFNVDFDKEGVSTRLVETATDADLLGLKHK